LIGFDRPASACEFGFRWLDSDAFQDVKVSSKGADLPLDQFRRSNYGNEVLYAETSKANKGEYKFFVDCDVVRRDTGCS
jgi:hypothetical protein